MLKASVDDGHSSVLVEVREEAVAYSKLSNLLRPFGVEVVPVVDELAQSAKHGLILTQTRACLLKTVDVSEKGEALVPESTGDLLISQ